MFKKAYKSATAHSWLVGNLCILLISIPLFLPLLHKGFFLTDDGEWMIIRLASFYEALRSGEFPVRFLLSLNQGYGYPVADFLYPGYMYLGSLLHILHFGFVDAVKLEFGLAIVIGGWGVYAWLRKYFAAFSSLVGAISYIYFPYHVYDMYTRGSLGEVLALAVVPLILYFIDRKKNISACVCIGLLILSHNILAVLFLPLIFLYALLSTRNIRITFTIVLFGLFSASFFWIPALYDLRYTVFLHTEVSNWSNYFARLDMISWVGGLVIIISPIVWLLQRSHANYSMHKLLYLVGLVSILLSLPLSTMLWHLLPVTFVQFPFRLLSVSMLSIAFFSAYLIDYVRQYRYLAGLLLCALIILCAYSFLQPTQYFDKGEGFYTTNLDTTTVKNEYMPLWVKQIPHSRSLAPVLLTDAHGRVRLTRFTAKNISFMTRTVVPATAQVNVIYFPGWEASVNGAPQAISYNNQTGTMTLPLQPGNNLVNLTFTETPVRLLSDLISICTIIGLGIIYLYTKRHEKHHQ